MLSARCHRRRSVRTLWNVRTVWKALATAAAVAGSSVAVANADSSLILPYPEAFGVIPATTYDSEHHKVGGALLAIEKMDSGLIRIVGTMEHGFFSLL